METTETNTVPPPINQLQTPGTLTFTIPSNYQVTIRETNGDDETNLSKIKNAKTAEAMAIFLAGIIVSTNIPGQEKPTATQIQAWKVNDKYYCLLKSRMFSLGPILKFKWVWPEDPKNPITYEEDLTQFDRDLSKDTGDESKDRTKIRMYPLRNATGREIELTSGKKIKYEFLTGVGEKQSLDISENETNNNTELVIRNLQWFDKGAWINVQNFGIFSSREMVAIRKDIIQHDIRFEMQISIENPFTSKMNYIPAIIVNDFFYPEEI